MLAFSECVFKVQEVQEVLKKKSLSCFAQRRIYYQFTEPISRFFAARSMTN